MLRLLPLCFVSVAGMGRRPRGSGGYASADADFLGSGRDGDRRVFGGGDGVHVFHRAIGCRGGWGTVGTNYKPTDCNT